jgi:hypothetical protein
MTVASARFAAGSRSAIARTLAPAGIVLGAALAILLTLGTGTASGEGISARDAVRIANRTPEVQSEVSRHRDLRPDSITLVKGSARYRISYLSGRKKLADVTVDGRTGRVIEAWHGVQAAWVMARGQRGHAGTRVDSWYVWIPLCLLFVAPFFDPRRPFRMLHLDLLVLIGGFGISHFFFNKGEIGTSVPLQYPVMAYLLARMLFAGFRPRRAGEPLIPLAPAALLVAGIVLLGGFRVGLDLTTATGGDAGYGSAIGAHRIDAGDPLYMDSGADDGHLDAYGPVNYLAYLPFVKVLPPTEAEISTPNDHDLPAARAATIFFDLLTIAGLLALGLRLRKGRAGRMLGLALAYAWVAFPYTLFPLMSNTNDTLISALLVWSLVALSSVPGRAVLVGLAAAARFAPLALAPLFASGRGEGSEHGILGRTPYWTVFSAVFLSVVGLSIMAFMPKLGGFQVFYDQTIGFQLARESPFSIWGQNPGLGPLLTVVKLAVIGLSVLVAFVPRRRDAVQVAALGAAVLLGLQFITVHWFYVYIVWFAPFVLVALFGEYGTGRDRPGAPACLEHIELPEPEPAPSPVALPT